MNTDAQTTVTVDSTNPDEAVIARAVEILTGGGLVVAPTDTRYGLLARYDMKEAVSKLVEIKGRSGSQPMAVFVENVDEIDSYGILGNAGRIVAENFLPGPLTLVLPTRIELPPPIVVEGKIGVRVPESPLITTLVRCVGVPLTATSANKSGHDDAASAGELYDLFSSDVSLYLDGGEAVFPASTVVQIVNEEIELIREGAVPEEALRRTVSRQRSL